MNKNDMSANPAKFLGLQIEISRLWIKQMEMFQQKTSENDISPHIPPINAIRKDDFIHTDQITFGQVALPKTWCWVRKPGKKNKTC